MALNIKIFVLLIVLILVLFTIYYISMLKLVYAPQYCSDKKYEIFIKKLKAMVEDPEYVQELNYNGHNVIYIHNPDTDGLTIYFHGAKGNIEMRYEMINFLYLHRSVIIFDTKKYGMSKGYTFEITCKKMTESSVEILNHVKKEMGFTTKNICFFGEDLGCLIAIDTFNDPKLKLKPNTFIFNYPYDNNQDIVKYRYGFIGSVAFAPINKFVSDPLNDISKSKFKSKPKSINILIAYNHDSKLIPKSSVNKFKKRLELLGFNISTIKISGEPDNSIFNDEYYDKVDKLLNI